MAITGIDLTNHPRDSVWTNHVYFDAPWGVAPDLVTLINEVADEWGAEIQALVYGVAVLTVAHGNQAVLATDDKATLVGALNSVKAEIDAIDPGALIDDNVNGGDSIWSSARIATEIGAKVDAAMAALVDGAPIALDTLAELANELLNNAAVLTDLQAAQAETLRVDLPQSFTAARRATGRDNMGAGPETTRVDFEAVIGNVGAANFLAAYEAAKTATN